MNALFTLLMMNDFFDSLERYDDREVTSGCFTYILIIAGAVVLFRTMYYIEMELAQYFVYFAVLSVFFTIAIPIIAMSEKGIDMTLSKALRILNIIVGFIVVWLLMAKLGEPIVTTFIDNLCKSVESVLKINIVIGFVVGLILLIIRLLGVALDLVFIPLCTIPFLQRMIWKGILSFKKKAQ